ncbi:CinA family protein [Brevibacterium luteolum]|uniref:CinA family protein n=1 Tax=Brevibacterium luteolum TaxID=199591 RepID=A0A2N6PJY2_9MICO|nr:CinA family protein [Brevibacterium luteolum]PMB98984.1 CinA family protein [Brevibacterium luteolum]
MEAALSESSAARAAAEVGRLAHRQGRTVAIAESLTGGKLAEVFAAVPDSSAWFAGGVVCFQSETKFRVLGVSRGPVVTEEAVGEMAAGVAERIGADAVVSVSGAAGPSDEEGNPPGTVWMATLVCGDLRTELHHFTGDPLEILSQTVTSATQLLFEALRESASD